LAVTQAIANLEVMLDVPLFVRRSIGTYPTHYGRILEKRTTRLCAIIGEAIRELAADACTVRRTARVCPSHCITSSQVRALIAIYEAGSFMQSARHLGISQASVHRSARSLEAQLQVASYPALQS
jgi:LysR family transcriptional regulator, regulator for genes of the gallate degradation pathway